MNAANKLYCEHGVNAKACLKCFHKPKPKAPPASAMPAALNPTQARTNAIVAAARGNAQQAAPIPAAAQVVPGAATQVPQVQSVPLPHVQRPRTQKSIDDHAPAPQVPMSSGFSYESRTAPIPFAGEKLWEPPPRTGKERRDVIDQLPSHPQPNGGR